MMRVSVVIPTFNREALLPRALDSVISQSMAPFEIIVVDDGSMDTTARIVTDRYPDVVYLSQENQGVSSARNLGISKASGEWIALLDSDDEWLPGKLEAQSTALAKEPHYRLCHTNEIWIRHGKRVNPMEKHKKYGGWIYEQCLPLCVISPSSVLIHRSVLRQFGCFDDQLMACEDYDLWLRICAFIPVLYLEEPHLRKYGGHEDQLSKQYWGMDRFRITALERMLLDDRLDEKNRSATIRMLKIKLEILLTGARRRGNREVIKQYADKLRDYGIDMESA